MKPQKKLLIFTCAIALALALVGCTGGKTTTGSNGSTTTTNNTTTTTENKTTTTYTVEVVPMDEEQFTIEYVSGTENAYTIENNVITFSNITEDSVYALSGEIDGSIVIDVSEDFKFELEFRDVTINSYEAPAIDIESADKVSLSFKKDTVNYINDLRAEVTDEDGINATIYAKCDLNIKGKGTLNLKSVNNKGIHTKDDLEVKNLTLNVECMDNALKGNDSVTIESGTLTLISKKGDGIKTSNSDISSKGNQRGTVTISGGNITIYAACDGIDASYNCVINEDEASVSLNIYTDKYSSYSEEVTDVSESVLYIKATSNQYYYSVKFMDNDGNYVWVDASYLTQKQEMGGRQPATYYYYTVQKPANYNYLNVFVYSSANDLSQEETYYRTTGSAAINESYDTIAVGNRFSWTNYQTTSGPGGMQEGNPDKGSYSTKGIKADNEILITAGTINIKSYDDAIHANNDNELENGETPTGNITINGGTLSLYSNDDGIHADGTLTITDGTIDISYSYEGIEGNVINITGGHTSIVSKDDGANAKTETGQGIVISGGYLYVYAGGDGLDANTRTNYQGIVFNGGNVIVISASGMNSSLDTERGYTYNSGSVLAVGLSGGMSNESVNASNFTSIGSKTSLSLTKDNYLTVKVSGDIVCVMKVPQSLNSFVVYLGSNSATFSTTSSTTYELNTDGVYFK